MNDKKMLAFWKANEKPIGLCPKEKRDWLKDARARREHFDGINWIPTCFSAPMENLMVYRIPADYDTEKKGRWVEYPIVKMDDRDIGMVWAFLCEHANDSIKLSDAPGMVGFGGVKYADGWHAHPHWEGRKDSEPVKPVAVRFWVEE